MASHGLSGHHPESHGKPSSDLIEPRLQRSVRTRPVVVLTGARQTGKTSTFRRLQLGLSQGQLSKVERGEMAPTLEMLLAVS